MLLTFCSERRPETSDLDWFRLGITAPKYHARYQHHVREITLACIPQHSYMFHCDGHWRKESGSASHWIVQDAIPFIEPDRVA
jgi:hypothetical protein